MNFELNYIGSYNGTPAPIIELTVNFENCNVTETITSWSTDKADEQLIENLENLLNELKEHNKKIEDEN